MSNLDYFVVLDLDSGTFFSAATSVIFDTRRLTESQLEILNEGSDDERCNLASECGSELEHIIDADALDSLPDEEPHVIHAIRTWRFGDATSRGWDIEFLSNDSARLAYHTNWQGEIAGETFIAYPPAFVLAAIRRVLNGLEHGNLPDLDAAVATWLETDDRNTWARVRCGSVIC